MAGRIQGICVELSGDSTKLQTALRGVNSEIRNTQSQLKDCEKLLKLDPGNTELIAQKYRLLGEAVRETKEKLETLRTASEQAEQALKDGTITQQQYDGLQREIAETEQKLKALEEQAKESAVALQKIGAAGEKLKDIGGKVEGLGKSLTTHVTLPLAAIGTMGVKSFADVDKTMQLTNKTMGNTEQQAELLNKAMKEAASNSTYGMKDAANATLNFARAGLTAEEAADTLAPAMNLAAGEGGNLDTVSAGLVATINGFHDSFGEAGHYADVFAAACNNSALDVDGLSGAMSVAAPVFSAAGYSVNDAALYMGVMANNGIEADKAANSLKTGLARLVSPAKEGKEAMAALNWSITDGNGQMKDCVTIQKELHDKFAGLSEAEQIAAASAIFGKNQMSPWLALINSAPEDVGALDESLRNCAGTTEEMAEAMMSGFGGSLEKLKSSMDVLVTSIGEALAPTIKKVADYIQMLVDKFNALSPAQQQLIVKIGLIVAVLGPVLLIVGKLITSVGTILTLVPKLVGFIGGLKGAFGALTGVLAANPFGLIVAGIAAAVAAFVYLWNHCEAFREFWINLWNRVKEAAVAVWNGLAAFFTGVWDVIRAGAAAAWEGIGALLSAAWEAIRTGAVAVWDGIGEALRAAWETIRTAAVAVWNGIGEALRVVWEAIRSGAEAAWSGIGAVLTNAWEAIQTGAETIWNGIRDFFAGIWEAISGLFGAALDGITAFLAAAWNGIRNTVTSVWNGIKAFFGTIWNGIRTITMTVVKAIKAFLSAAWNGIRDIVTARMNAVRASVTAVWNAIRAVTQSVISGIRSVVSSGWSAVRNAVVSAVNAIRNAVSDGWNRVKAIVLGVAEAIRSGVKTAFDAMLGGIRDACGNIYGAVTEGFDRAVEFITGLASSAFQWGADFIGGIVDGIWSMIDSVADAVWSVADTIRSFLHFSVPDKGPLTEYEKWMPDFIEGLAEGIEKSRGLVEEAVEKIAEDMVVSPRVMVKDVVAEDGSAGIINGSGFGNGYGYGNGHGDVFGSSGRNGSERAGSNGSYGTGGYGSMYGGAAGGAQGLHGDLMGSISAAVKSAMAGGAAGDIVIPVYIGGDMIDEVVVTAQQRMNLRSGGR